jgi:hypothetical protein
MLVGTISNAGLHLHERYWPLCLVCLSIDNALLAYKRFAYPAWSYRQRSIHNITKKSRVTLLETIRWAIATSKIFLSWEYLTCSKDFLAGEIWSEWRLHWRILPLSLPFLTAWWGESRAQLAAAQIVQKTFQLQKHLIYAKC